MDARRLGPSRHVDSFTRQRLPPPDAWPTLLLDRPEFQYPERLDAAVKLTDRMVERGFGERVALIGEGRGRSYREFAEWTNRLARALVEDYGVIPGQRVLLRSGNNPAFVAASLAVTKSGAVAVNTMPTLRAAELTKIVDQAEIYAGALRQAACRRSRSVRARQHLSQARRAVRRRRRSRRRA